MPPERLCPHCSSPVKEEVRPVALHGVRLGRFPVLVCTVCHRVYHPEKTSQAIEEAAKSKGVWGLLAVQEPTRPVVVRDTSRQIVHVFLAAAFEPTEAEPELVRVKRNATEKGESRTVTLGQPTLVPAGVAEVNSNASPGP